MLVRLSWTTASPHGVVVHHRFERARPADRGQPLQKIMEGVWTISSESDVRSSLMRDRAMHRLSITEAHLVVRKNLYISAQGRAKAGKPTVNIALYKRNKFA